MEARNGRARAATTPIEKASTDKGLSSHAYTVAYEHPTPHARWACHGEDPNLFHPVDEDTLVEALNVCARCPARAACFDLGTLRKEWGVWGGVLLENGKPLDRVRPERGAQRKRSAA